MRQSIGLLMLATVLGFCQLQASGQEKKKEEPKLTAEHSFRNLDGRPLVFVVNGAGGSTSLSDNLMQLNSDKHLGLRIQMVPWCRQNAFFADLTDQQAQLQAATHLACTIAAIHKECPHVPIFVMGNSAGARVALAAAEMSPEKSIERVIVIAPAVSCGYDLKGVLKASKCGVDNFYSCDDNVLEAAVYYATLADGTRTAAAGQVGFQAPGDPRAAALYCNVRNYPWNDSFVGGGGHFAWTRPHNMKKVLPPLLTPCMCVVSFEPAPPGVRKMPAAK